MYLGRVIAPVAYYSFEGRRPVVHPDAVVSTESTLIGDVTLHAGASVWPGTVVRGDANEAVSIGENTHVEDLCMVHVAELGERTLVGHGVVLDASIVGDRCLVGSGTVLNNNVEIGARTIVAAGSVVPDGRTVPAESFVRGVPAEVVPLEASSVDHETVFELYSTEVYDDLTARYDDLFESGDEIAV